MLKTFFSLIGRSHRGTKLFALEGLLILLLIQCGYKSDRGQISQTAKTEKENSSQSRANLLRLGIENTEWYRQDLLGKKVGVVSNQTGMIENTHLVDTLLGMGVNVVKVFAPEHGFRGTADAGEHISSTKDAKTGLPIMSLYGKTKKPTKEMMEGLDVMVFDIQDVGVRFYTYISTLHYVMEACAEAGIPLYVFDRPNPNAHYVDGPVLEKEQTSFVGMHPVPVVYGMTIGEYAKMIDGEGWLPNNLKCELKVVPMRGYWYKRKYELPVPPSPNLRTSESIQLYPSLCFFEATSVSVGRGTETPFEIYGHPNFPKTDFSFTPKSSLGSKQPLQENQLCHGYNLHDIGAISATKLDLSYFINAQKLLKNDPKFITNASFFHKLAGNTTLLKQIQTGMSEEEIRATWQKDLEAFQLVRAKYLMY
jgi:uncharacterized protein YbbC (DUF1343 family)